MTNVLITDIEKPYVRNYYKSTTLNKNKMFHLI